MAVASVVVNHLADETSPYLRQHADNPVEWYPWGDAAFERAKEEDKPIFLSIGYASCHWCHVMAHESFENQVTADDLSKWFVSVKVDREERPDIDSLYMAATQSLTGSGGWPMSVFCTPDGRPFYAGTYFPPEERHGMPAFRQVIEALGTAWVTRRDDVLAQADALVEAVRREVRLDESLRVDAAATAVDVDADQAIEAVVVNLAGGFDPTWGGFGPPPKFPRPTHVELCLRHYRRTGSARSRQMALTTLDGMAAGGMYDHLAGGFCRYSTDQRWLVPHFEKMLTDQALLARVYLHAWQETGQDDYLGVVNETLDFVLRELSTPEGALYSSFDADAGGVEGAHATFTMDELRCLLPPSSSWPRPSGTASPRRATGRAGAFPSVRSVPLSGARPKSRTRVPCWPRPGPSGPTRSRREGADRVERHGHIHPGRGGGGDRARATYARAEEIGEFLLESMYVDGRLMRSWQGGRARHLGVAADHAWLIEACVRLSELTGRRAWRERAQRVAGELLDLFFDVEGGGFFTTGHDAEALVVRPKEFLDGAVPSANSIAVSALLRVDALADNPAVREAVDTTIALATPLLDQHPGAVADLVAALPMQRAARKLW